MMKVIIAGSRNFNNYSLLKQSCDNILVNQEEVEIVSGTCSGADKLGEEYAKERGFTIKQFPADWSLGKKAGYIRNIQMAEYADALICFWDGVSKGSKNMIDIAKERNLKVRIINGN